MIYICSETRVRATVPQGQYSMVFFPTKPIVC